MAHHSDRHLPRALVTGHRGFTGRYVVAELARAGYEVHGLTQRRGGESVDVDLMDRDQVKDAVREIEPDVVLHLAAIAFVGHANSDAIYNVNVLGTRHLLEALDSCNRRPSLVVLASSANIYGNADVGLISEDVRPSPVNDYAVSKLSMEYMSNLWIGKLPITVCRPFNYTGVGQSEDFLIPKIVAHFRRGDQAIELGNLDVVRDFSDVRDIAKIYAALVTARPVGRTVNICSGTGCSLSDILRTLSELAGYVMDVRVNPAFVRANEVKRLIGSRDMLDTLVPGISRHPLKETLAWMFEA